MCSSRPSELPISSSVSPSPHHATTVRPASSTPSTCANSRSEARTGRSSRGRRGSSRAGAAPGRRRARSRRARARPRPRSAGVCPAGAPATFAHVSDHEQRGEHGGVEQALGDHRGEDLPPPRGRAAAEQADAQDLAAAHRQHVVAHVADERQPVGVGALVRDPGQAQDAVPAEAAHAERHAVDADGAERATPSRLRESGNCGVSCFEIHHATAASETTETRRLRRRWVLGLMCGMSAAFEAAVQPAAHLAVHRALRRVRGRARHRGARPGAGSRRGSGGPRGTRRAR